MKEGSDLPREVVEERLDRLARLQGADPGLFVLAVHSFVEAYCRQRCTLADPDFDGFGDWLDALRHDLISAAGGAFVEGLDVLGNLRGSRHAVNGVRHEFLTMTVVEAQAATQHLARFCALVGIPGGTALKKVQEYIENWRDRRSSGELQQALKEAGFHLQMEKNRSKSLTERMSALEAIESEATILAAQKKSLEVQIQELSKAKETKDERIKSLRDERASLQQELREKQKRIAEFDDVREYAALLEKQTVYTRTRSDYERMVTRLTPEQSSVLSQISLQKDFLVKGAAGTGKTLVLLKAIEKAKGVGLQTSLAMDELDGSVVLLTYTKTLVKYASYIAILVNQEEGDLVATADKFLIDRFHELHPKEDVNFSAAETFAAKVPFPPLEPRLLAAEAENFIWANLVTREEYLEKGIERTGMKTPLQKNQRVEVWKAVETMERMMKSSGKWSKNLAAAEIIRASLQPGESLSKVDYVFIDEAQDLSTAALAALKSCARRCIVLAGDGDQSIYQPFFSYRRAGIDIAGRTKILRANFRNTVQLHAFAERYRAMSQGYDSETTPEAFREGPAPELFEADSSSDLQDLLAQRLNLFLNRLGYDPENIGIIAPTREDLKGLSLFLADKGYSTSDIRDDDFSFNQRGQIRMTTMHSAKGLDFPVALVYLPRLNFAEGSWSDTSVDKQNRNLIYVAVTRAMDHCNLFLRTGSINPVLRDLADALASPENKSKEPS